MFWPVLVFSFSVVTKKFNEMVIDDANVESIVRSDANALYLSTIGDNMPTGPLLKFIRSQQQNYLVTEKHKM